tara:strand:- start:1055 stop:1321 length:267 start_codon:yes stop_codon:yes gene_type:complete
MKNTISKKYVVDYIENDLGEIMRHDPASMTGAIRETAKVFGLNKYNLFHYIVERADTISGTQSYGFDTEWGRAIRAYFESEYYKFLNQ